MNRGGAARGERASDLAESANRRMGYGASRLTHPTNYDKDKFLAQPVYSRDFPPCRYCE